MFSVLNYGAKPGSGFSQTSAIQAAIEACRAAGGGTVLIPAGTFVTGTLFLLSHVTLHLENGARLVGSTRLEDYPEVSGGFVDAVGQKRNRCLIYAKNTTHTCITGPGTIDGSGGHFAPDQDGRPFLVRFIDCTEVQVTGVTLVDSAGWVSHFLGCENILIQGVTIRSHVNGNNDGIDVDSCRRVRINACDIDTGDDAICLKSTRATPCENIVVTGCILRSIWGALKIGTESVGDIRNVIFSDCVIRDTEGGGLKIISMDGSRLENIQVSNLIMDNVSGPIFIRLGARLRQYHPDQPDRPIGVLRNVTIRNVTGRVWEKGYLLYGKHPRKAGIIVTGIPGHPVEHLTFENINLLFPGGGPAADTAEQDGPELVAEYPEFPIFHPIPAWGFYLRHVRQVTLRHIHLQTEEPDDRPALRVREVENLVTENFS
jgi:polygalacturonase